MHSSSDACRRHESVSDPGWTGSPELCAALQGKTDATCTSQHLNTLLVSPPIPVGLEDVRVQGRAPGCSPQG